MERGIINDDIYFTLNDRLMNDPGINIILFGIQHYTKFRFKSSHLLLMDDMVLRTQMFQLRPRAIVDTIITFCEQEGKLKRNPGTNNWFNQDLSKKGGLYTLLD